ncbi:M56 family metallopeptidase [Flavivirga aquimarina]|uniref:M56 family metallopeptidase n=1 Tax=Flavivirga aquimarina TaxID=2027862 RepID=A0ABT8W669_9FLAO|nr:M56 family metallopeptidase [Flavivirga aquimarina]MDO5968562.1 M56 family metallopeptidase [Flavivirga aquimarina]
MLLLILKSSTCLAVFMLFYKLCLEKTSAHTFKRFYLIASTLISIAIPFITFTEYIEAEPVNFALGIESQNYSNLEITDITEPKNYLPAILWSIYALGAILFSIRFFKNLHQLFKKIKDNPKYKNQYFINVLITDLITPHTFFNYIFLNKTKFENNLIPNEVLFHEQTHAKQMHALDLLFIEVLQILFWFNPLLYFIKKDIKLNHEFLADQAVIKHGIDSSIYQKTLLAFSSPDSYREASDSSLVNAINYSSIKKRFTVMKTKTSKTALWLRSLIILPLLAILIYGFSDKVVIEKENIETNVTNNKIRIFINKDREVFIENDLVIFNNMSEAITKIKNRLIKKHSITPELFIEVEGHVTDEYFKAIVNEIKKTNLKVTEFKSDSLLLNKEGSIPYFKGTHLTANYIVFKTETGEILEGVSIPKNTTYSENENLKSLLNYLREKEKNLVQSLSKEKNEKEKIEIEEQIDFLKSRTKIVSNRLNFQSKKSSQNQDKIKHKESIKNTYRFIFYLDNDDQIAAYGKWVKSYDLKKIIKEYTQATNKNSTEIELVIRHGTSKKTISEVKSILNEYGKLKVKFTDKEGWLSTEKKQKTISDKNIEKSTKSELIIKIIDNKTVLINDKMCLLDNAETCIVKFLNTLSRKEKKGLVPIIIYNSPDGDSALENLNNILRDYNLLRINKKIKINGEPFPPAPEAPKVKEGFEIPPPPPPTTEPLTKFKSSSEKLLKAWKEYSTEGDAYGTAMQAYFKNKTGNLSDLKIQYEKVMELYKAYKELSEQEKESPVLPPPPPPQESVLGHIISMSKKGAIFYYNDKEITSEKAIEIAKKDKNLDISVKYKSDINTNVVTIKTKPSKP